MWDWIEWARELLEELVAQGETLRMIAELLREIWEKLP